MASRSGSGVTVTHTHIPHPSEFDGIPPEDDIDRSVPKPVYTVVEASQLPADFLEPKPENRLVVGFDCEGVELCRYGSLCLMQALYFQFGIKLNNVVDTQASPTLRKKKSHSSKTDSDQGDWPPLPLLPGMEAKILSVVDVPAGSMGKIIGKKGVAIRSLKESTNAEIIIGGSRGPPDKVFVIGSPSEVYTAKAILRGRVAF